MCKKFWAARNKDYGLSLYNSFPVKSIENGFWYADNDNDCNELYLLESMFPDVKWEDDNPTEVELVIKKKHGLLSDN